MISSAAIVNLIKVKWCNCRLSEMIHQFNIKTCYILNTIKHSSFAETASTGAVAAVPSDAPLLRAAVTESGNEISCSIDETNRLRAALGLKPLRVETREEAAAAARARVAEAERARAVEEADSIRLYLEKVQ